MIDKISNEGILWKGSPSQAINIGNYLIASFSAIFLIIVFSFISSKWPNLFGQYSSVYNWVLTLIIVLSLLRIFWLWLEVKTHSYQITEERLRQKIGIFSRRIDDLELYRVKDTIIEQPFLLRLVGLANLIVESSDRSTPVVKISAIPHVAEVQHLIRERTEIMRKQKGVREFD